MQDWYVDRHNFTTGQKQVMTSMTSAGERAHPAVIVDHVCSLPSAFRDGAITA